MKKNPTKINTSITFIRRNQMHKFKMENNWLGSNIAENYMDAIGDHRLNMKL